jgi:hypothetical protein
MESQLIQVMILKMQTIQFALIVNLIQMKSMKVIYTRENMMNQEFQHCLESQLSEVMILKMHSIQFALIVNVIQMKSMKVIHRIDLAPSPLKQMSSTRGNSLHKLVISILELTPVSGEKIVAQGESFRLTHP